MHLITRREAVKRAAAAAAGATLLHTSGLNAMSAPEHSGTAPRILTDDTRLAQRYQAAVEGLGRNVLHVFRFPGPVLIEGGRYPGIWLECGPQEGLVYSVFNPEVGKNNHRIFFALQREDGYLPCNVKADHSGTGQIQSVVPIAATAMELAERTGDEELLTSAYRACSAWDAWLMRYRNTRGTGLCEAFCGYDTGMDRNARFKGIPWTCPGGDARICPDLPTMPYLAPDLSATVYGERKALAGMARMLGKASEAAQWEERAESLRKALMKWCFDADDLFFYDRDARNHLIRIRTVVILRIFGSQVVEPKLFEAMYQRHVRNPKEFWTPYPFPSVAVNDPAYDAHPPLNSWCGPSQALTALRAPRWMEPYGKSADLTRVMQAWVRVLREAADFQQQLDPLTGRISTGTQYSPAMLVMTDFVARLFGVRQERDRLEWNCRLPEKANNLRYEQPTPRGTAVLEVKRHGSGMAATLTLAGRRKLAVEGGAVRVVTDTEGMPLYLVGTDAQTVTVHMRTPHRQGSWTVAPDASVAVKM